MGKLIKNELIKVFHKKAIYVVLVIILGLMILSAFLYNSDYYEWSLEDQLATYQDILDNWEEYEEYGWDETDKYYYETEIEIIKLQQKYGEDSWQTAVINNYSYGYEIIYNTVYNMLAAEGTDEYSEYESQYNEIIKRFDEDDWKSFANDELDDVNLQIAELEEAGADEDDLDLKNLKAYKQAIEWRLEKDIAYGDTNMNNLLETWWSGKYTLNQYEEDAKTSTFTYEEKTEKEELEGTVALAEYAIINGIDDNIGLNYVNERESLMSSSDAEIIGVFENYSILLIAVIIVAGTIISEEFSKGTIKLLLVKPYKRTKILMAKFITCLIVLLIVMVVTALMQVVVSGFTYGFDDISSYVVTYNYSTNEAQSIGVFSYMMLMGLGILPMFLLIMTLAFTISVITCNSAISIALPLLGLIFAETINELVYYYEKAKFLIYFVTPNWNWSIYLFGKMPDIEALSLPFSVVICVIYFVIMIFASIFIFKKRDIKNT